MIDYSLIIDRYVSHFGKDDISDCLMKQLHNHEHIIDRKNMNGHIVCSPFVFNSDFSKLLCIYHKARSKRQQPGGHIDDMMYHPFVHGLRELKEETGLDIVRLHDRHLSHDLCPIRIETQEISARIDKNEGEHLHYDIEFVCIAQESLLSASDDDEIDNVCRIPIDELSEEMRDRVNIIKKRLHT